MFDFTVILHMYEMLNFKSYWEQKTIKVSKYFNIRKILRRNNIFIMQFHDLYEGTFNIHLQTSRSFFFIIVIYFIIIWQIV